MKYILSICLVFLLFSCDNTTYNLSHQPNDFVILKYKMSLVSDVAEIDQITEFKISRIDESNFGVVTTIKKMKSYMVSDYTKRNMHSHDQFVNEPMYFEFDTIGNITQGVDYKYQWNPEDVFDVSLYFIKYPDHPVQIGETWETEIDAIDFGYSKIHRTYTLTSVNPETIIIDVESEYKGSGNNGFYDAKKTTTGNYSINRKNGSLIRAYITLFVTIENESTTAEIKITKR